MSLWIALVVGSVCLLILADLLVHFVCSLAALHRFETLPSFHVLPPPQDAPSYEPIRFPTTDQLELGGGIYFPEDCHPRGVVLFCPETGGGFDTAMNYAEPLLEAGFAVVSFSFRNQAPSDTLASYRSNYWVTDYEVEDIHAALDFIQAQPQFYGLPIGLIGVSRGSGAALSAGAQRPEVSLVWTQGAFSSKGLALFHAHKFLQMVVGKWDWLIPRWHVHATILVMLSIVEFRNHCKLTNVEKLLPQWRGRGVMFVSGSRDTYVPPVLTDKLCRLTGNSPETAQWIVPQAKHNLERATAPQEFDMRIVKFFQQMVPQTSPFTKVQSTIAR